MSIHCVLTALVTAAVALPTPPVSKLSNQTLWDHHTYAYNQDESYNQWLVSQFTSYNRGNVGIVAATSDSDEFATSTVPGADLSVSSTTVFEVGSTTKTFTTLAAELLAGQGKLAMTDTLAERLPSTVKLAPDVGSITLLELASHTSGLARMPSNIDPTNPDPMAHYTEQDLYAYLESLTTVGPKEFLYSNTGFGLLGWVTCLVSGQGWEQLIQESILMPLGMNSTGVKLNADMQSRLAPPNDANGRPTGFTTFTDAFVGAGGLRSTPADMLKYVTGFAGLAESSVPEPMRSAMDRMTIARAADEYVPMRGQVAEAFQLYTLRKEQVVWKDGATTGYNCLINFIPGKKASVVLSNIAAGGMSSTFLPGAMIMAGPPPQHTPVSVSSATIESYAGTFHMAGLGRTPPATITVIAAGQSTLSIEESFSQSSLTMTAFSQSSFFSVGTRSYTESYHDSNTVALMFQGQDHYACREGPCAALPIPPSSQL